MATLLAIIPDNLYTRKLSIIIRQAERMGSKILFVSLNKTYGALLKSFKKENIATEKFLFIDTITSIVMDSKANDRCLFLESPEDVRALYRTIIKEIKTKKIDTLIFDSLSSLIVYKNQTEVSHFVNFLVGSLSALNCAAIFTCLRSDEDTSLIMHIKQKVDNTFKLHDESGLD